MVDHPEAILFAEGSTKSRTRLYQMGISKISDDFFEMFEIEGLIDGGWEPFQKGKNYESFLLKLKFLMAAIKQVKKVRRTLNVDVDDDVKDYSKDPFFVKKRERAKEVIDKYGIPEHFLKSTGSK
jgi:hypothetical protein